MSKGSLETWISDQLMGLGKSSRSGVVVGYGEGITWWFLRQESSYLFGDNSKLPLENIFLVVTYRYVH